MSQKLVCILAILIPLHIFEEDSIPGGFYYMNNLSNGSDHPMAYPQSELTNMITNLGAEVIVILLPFAISSRVKSERFAFDDIGYFKKFEQWGNFYLKFSHPNKKYSLKKNF